MSAALVSKYLRIKAATREQEAPSLPKIPLVFLITTCITFSFSLSLSLSLSFIFYLSLFLSLSLSLSLSFSFLCLPLSLKQLGLHLQISSSLSVHALQQRRSLNVANLSQHRSSQSSSFVSGLSTSLLIHSQPSEKFSFSAFPIFLYSPLSLLRVSAFRGYASARVSS